MKDKIFKVGIAGYGVVGKLRRKFIEGKSTIIKEGDIVFIERNRQHHITAVGDSASLRLAVSRYDVEHVYKDGSYQE